MQAIDTNRDQVRSRFERDGFLVVPDLFTPAETQAWKTECKRILAEVTQELQTQGKQPGFTNTGVFVGLSIRSEVIQRMNRDPRLLDRLEAIMGPNIMFWSDKVVFKAEDVHFGSPWHQDWPYWKGCHKLNAWIALDDVDQENGCLKLLPGSHQQSIEHEHRENTREGFGNRVEQLDESQAVSVPVRAGSVVFFHDLTLHASHPNTNGRDRWAIISTFKDPLADDLDYPAMTAATVVRGHGRQ